MLYTFQATVKKEDGVFVMSALPTSARWRRGYYVRTDGDVAYTYDAADNRMMRSRCSSGIVGSRSRIARIGLCHVKRPSHHLRSMTGVNGSSNSRQSALNQ